MATRRDRRRSGLIARGLGLRPALALAGPVLALVACPPAAAAPTCQVIQGAPSEAASLLAAAPHAASDASSATEAAIDLATAEPTAAGLHTGPRYDFGEAAAGLRAAVPQMVQWYLRLPGAQVRVCDATSAATPALGARLDAASGGRRYYPITPVWRSPAGLCHFSMSAQQDRELLARPDRNLDEDEAWRYQLFVAPAERCDSVEIERYVETAGVSDRDLATFFKMWHAFVASPVRFELALRRFEHAAPAGLWRPPAEIDLLAQARERLRIVSIVNAREGDGLLERISDGMSGPRLGVYFARIGDGDPRFDVRLGWGTMSLLAFRARQD